MPCLHAIFSFVINIMDLNATLGFSEIVNSQSSLEQFELLYKRWGSILEKYAYYYVKDDEAARSIVNDLFLQLWFRNRQPENLKGYLFRAIKNASINYLSQQKNNPLSYIEEEDLRHISDLSTPAEETKYESEKVRFLQNVIQQLPERRQLVFRMYRLEGFSYAEIAELMQISVRTVEDHLSKSMQFIHARSKHLVHQKLTEA